jgi:drug/metabolite transporter (DMT)-like permease
VILRERAGKTRIVAAVIVVAGVVLLRLA